MHGQFYVISPIDILEAELIWNNDLFRDLLGTSLTRVEQVWWGLKLMVPLSPIVHSWKLSRLTSKLSVLATVSFRLLLFRGFVFEVWAEKTRLLDNLNMPQAIAGLLHLAFVFDLKYPEVCWNFKNYKCLNCTTQESETVADILQRLVARYGDDTGKLLVPKKYIFQQSCNHSICIINQQHSLCIEFNFRHPHEVQGKGQDQIRLLLKENWGFTGQAGLA